MQGKGEPLPLQPIPKTKNNNKTKTNNKIKVVYTEDWTHPNGTSDLPLRLKPPAVRMVPGVWLTARPCHWLFPLLTSTRSVFLGCWTRSSLTELNRRMRTRMYGGVAGEER